MCRKLSRFSSNDAKVSKVSTLKYYELSNHNSWEVFMEKRTYLKHLLVILIKYMYVFNQCLWQAKMEAYHHCKDCDFKTELTVVFEQHINQHHDPKRESSEDISSEDSSKENYGCAKYYFEPNLSLKSFQNSSVCTETKESSQSVSSLEESATCSSDFKQTEEVHWYYCHKCTYKCKVKKTLTRHIDVLHSHRWYACDKCPFKTKWKGNLTVHINTIHLDEYEGKWYKCQKCQFKTRTKDYDE
ncbi:B-cell lymphoma 6 protein homolog [Zophobas morio]|uniref:B-cell lymphoma 6 protein homolog n=1 Tax=Zophobas morio TaxID=2755281 RepID=UPI0030829E96